MVGRKAAFTVFLIIFCISILFIILSRFGILNGLSSILSKATLPIQKSIYSSFGRVLQVSDNEKLKKLEEENLALNKKIVDKVKLEKDIQALRDQFAISNPTATNLLPANILGFPSFIPNVSLPETLIIDKGTNDGVKVGQAVIYKDNLVGKIAKITSNKAVVYLATHPDFTFTAKILNTKTEGIVKGLGGGEMILDNVLLSDNLNKNDIVLTKGDLTIDNTFFPSDLIVGKVISVDKTPSALFQTAGIQSLVDFAKLDIVFIYVGSK